MEYHFTSPEAKLSLSDNIDIIVHFEVICGEDFEMKWHESQYNSALEYATERVKHWNIKSARVNGTPTIPTITLFNPKNVKRRF